MKSYCVILAGGSGSRMGGNTPKQFMLLGGVPIVLRTLQQVLRCKTVDTIVIAVHPNWVGWLKDMLTKSKINSGRVLITIGGKDRNESISNALRTIHICNEIKEEDVVIIHDAVRPFVSLEVLENSIKAAYDFGACVATVPAIDTMLQVVDGIVVSVPKRSNLFHGQAPDTVRILLLERTIAALAPEERKTITGTAQILVMKGIPVRAIPGNPENIKITTPHDLEVAKCIVEKFNL